MGHVGVQCARGVLLCLLGRGVLLYAFWGVESYCMPSGSWSPTVKPYAFWGVESPAGSCDAYGEGLPAAA